jgi:hypothetical protein
MSELPVTVAVRIDPNKLANPDLDLRYVVADRIVQLTRSTTDDGYDYVGSEPKLVIYFSTNDPDEDVEAIIKLLTSEKFLGNDLKNSMVIAIRSDREFPAVFPPDATGPFQ